MQLDQEFMSLIEQGLANTFGAEEFYEKACDRMGEPFSPSWWMHRHYWECRARGTGPRLAEMFACAQPPQSKTDVEFLRGSDQQFSQGPLAEQMGNFYKSVAESQGQCTKGKVYKSGLAIYPGDPRAWVSDRHEVQSLVEERNWASRGDVEHKADNSRESV